MAESQTTPVGLKTDLGEILAAELEACSRLAETAEAVRSGLAAHHPQDLLQAIRGRDAALKELAALERRAAELRSRNAELPVHLHAQRNELRRLINQLSREEIDLQELAGETLQEMRRQLRGLRTGAQLLRSYRGPVAAEPRFSDRRG